MSSSRTVGLLGLLVGSWELLQDLCRGPTAIPEEKKLLQSKAKVQWKLLPWYSSSYQKPIMQYSKLPSAWWLELLAELWELQCDVWWGQTEAGKDLHCS